MSKLIKILLVDDDEGVLKALNDLFKETYETLTAKSGQEAIEVFEKNPEIATVIMDIKMSGMDGITASRKIREIDSDIAVIFHTGFPGDYEEELIDEQEQPYGYVQKGNSIVELQRTVKNAVNTYLLKHNVIPYNSNEETYGLVGKSLAMQEVYHLMGRLIGNDSKVMIYGETGTGKEMVAHAIHRHSKRAQNKIAILNCNHRSPDLIESELFGHVKGAFTSAVADQIGLFEYANGGTIFLDEISELDKTTQTKLLRVLDTGQYSPIGVPHQKITDIRIMCASNKKLDDLVSDGSFREDLFYRLGGTSATIIHLPPLRKRKEDIPLLIEKHKEYLIYKKGIHPKIFDQSAIKMLIQYDWPGNVRELFDIVESLMVLTDSSLIMASDVDKLLSFDRYETDPHCTKLTQKLKDIERTLIIEALIETKGSVPRAAQLLGMDRSNLFKKIKAYTINTDSFK